VNRLADPRRGASLVVVLAASLLAGSLVLVALRSAVVHARVVADARWHTEAILVASAALAEVRVADRTVFDTLPDGTTWTKPDVDRPDGWSWHVEANRHGAIVQLTVAVRRLAADGTVFAARRASLLLVRNPADTVRVLGRRARF
jgi:hypothetical protein